MDGFKGRRWSGILLPVHLLSDLAICPIALFVATPDEELAWHL